MTSERRSTIDTDIALRMRAAGLTWMDIARALGVTPDTVRRRIDPGYAEHRNANNRAARSAHRRPASASPKVFFFVAMNIAARLDGERLLAQVPPDTRGYTARLLGDPLPGRSALDRKGMQN